MTNKLKIARTVTEYVAVECVAFIFSSTLRRAVPTVTRLQKVKLFVGSYVIGAMIGEVTKNYVGMTFDKTVETFKKLKKQVEQEPVQ